MSKAKELLEDMCEGRGKRISKDIGNGTHMTLEETPDGHGFYVDIKGTFMSGDGLKETASAIEKAWSKIELD